MASVSHYEILAIPDYQSSSTLALTLHHQSPPNVGPNIASALRTSQRGGTKREVSCNQGDSALWNYHLPGIMNARLIQHKGVELS